MTRGVALLVALAGCAADDTPASWLEPADGQTGVPADLAVRVAGAGAELPPDYPIDAVVTVVDYDGGGHVGGRFAIDGDDVWFEPWAGFRDDTRYAVTVRQPDTVPHGPEFVVPANLIGTTLFETGDAVRILSRGAFEGEQACVILSRPADAVPDDVRITADDVEVSDAALVPVAFAAPVTLQDGDPGFEVRCVESAQTFAPGTWLRVFWGDESYHVALGDGSIDDVLAEQYRLGTGGGTR